MSAVLLRAFIVQVLVFPFSLRMRIIKIINLCNNVSTALVTVSHNLLLNIVFGRSYRVSKRMLRLVKRGTRKVKVISQINQFIRKTGFTHMNGENLTFW